MPRKQLIGLTIAEHPKLVNSFSEFKTGISPYLITQGSKAKVAFSCSHCNSTYPHRVDNLTGPSRSKGCLKCLMDGNHDLSKPIRKITQGATSGKSTWNSKFAEDLIPHLDKLSAKHPVFSTYQIGIDSILRDSWGFPSNCGNWDVFVYFPIINQLVVIDVDSFMFHAKKPERDVRKSNKWSAYENVLSIRLREEGLGFASTEGNPMPSNGYEVEDAFSHDASNSCNFDNGINSVMQILQFLVRKYLMLLAVKVDSKEFCRLNKTISRIHGARVARQIDDFRNAKIGYLESQKSGVKFIKTAYPSFYKAYYDNVGCDNWNATRSISYKQKILGAFVRSQFA